MILQRTKPLENLAQHFNIVIKNAVYGQRRTFIKDFSKGKTWHCKSIAKRISVQKVESSLIKSFFF